MDISFSFESGVVWGRPFGTFCLRRGLVERGSNQCLVSPFSNHRTQPNCQSELCVSLLFPVRRSGTDIVLRFWGCGLGGGLSWPGVASNVMKEKALGAIITFISLFSARSSPSLLNFTRRKACPGKSPALLSSASSGQTIKHIWAHSILLVRLKAGVRTPSRGAEQ